MVFIFLSHTASWNFDSPFVTCFQFFLKVSHFVVSLLQFEHSNMFLSIVQPSSVHAEVITRLFLTSGDIVYLIITEINLIATISCLLVCIVDNLRCLDEEREEKDLGKEARNVTEKYPRYHETGYPQVGWKRWSQAYLKAS